MGTESNSQGWFALLDMANIVSQLSF